MKLTDIGESVAGPESCWPGHRKVGTKPGTGKNAGKQVNDCEKIKEDSVAEGGFKNMYAEFSGYGNYMQGRAVNVFKTAGLEIVSKDYTEDDDIQTYVVKGDRQSIEKAGEYLERNAEQFGGYHFVKSGVTENYPKHQDLSGISTDKLKAYLAKQGQQQGSGEGGQVKRVQAELQRRSQGVAEGSDIAYHQTSGTKAGYTISSRKLSNKPQASKSDVTLQSGSMHHSGKSYNFPKGTLFTQLPGGIFAKHPSVPETHPGYGHLIRRSEDNIQQIHSALNSMSEMVGYNQGKPQALGFTGRKPVAKKNPNPFDKSPEDKKSQLQRMKDAGKKNWYAIEQQGVAEGSSTNAEVTKRAKAAAQKAGKTFNTDVEYRLWYAITTQANAATRKADKKQGVSEGMMDNPGEQDSPVAQAIIRRILLQRTDLLAKHGPEKVGQAVDEVADFVGDVDEIGSSDVSGWVRHVEQMLGNMGEGVAEGTDTLNVGDDVIITGAVKYKGATGVVDSVGRDGNFIVVDLYNHGKQSFQSTDVSYNDYAGSEAEETEMQQRGLGESTPRSALGKAISSVKIISEAAKGHTIEAHGVKGMKNSVWRKTFKNAEQATDWAEKNDAEIHGTRDLEQAKKGNLSPAVKEGAKVDRMVKHIAKSERESGKSKDEAEDIAWATANKRGMLDNKNKKTESTEVRTSKKY
jgi:hypothetical protein